MFRRDRGSVSLWVVIFAFIAFALLILVVDGGQEMNAKSRAADIAEQAARAAADEGINVPALRAGTVQIEPSACNAGGPADNLIKTYAKGIGVTASMTNPNGGLPCQVETINGVPAVQVWVQVQMKPTFAIFPFRNITAQTSEVAYLACGSDTKRTAC